MVGQTGCLGPVRRTRAGCRFARTLTVLDLFNPSTVLGELVLNVAIDVHCEPYKGDSEQFLDNLGGRIDAGLLSGVALALIQGGRRFYISHADRKARWDSFSTSPRWVSCSAFELHLQLVLQARAEPLAGCRVRPAHGADAARRPARCERVLPGLARGRAVSVRRYFPHLGGSLILASVGLAAFLGKWESDQHNAGLVYADKLAGGIPTICKGLTRHVTSRRRRSSWASAGARRSARVKKRQPSCGCSCSSRSASSACHRRTCSTPAAATPGT